VSTATAPPVASGYRLFFLVAAVYDIALGVVFFFFYQPIFSALNLELPYNISYIHLMAAFVFTQGVGYWLVYRDPVGNVGIVQLGALYKALYSGLAAYYLVIGQLIHAVFAWFGLFDLLFLIGFLAFLREAGRRPT
jgi:hypothetical protein